MANFHARTARFLATVTAFLLVLLFGNHEYQNWVGNHAAGKSTGDLFLQTLAWPHWELSGNNSIRGTFSDDLTAILIVVLTWVFVLLVGRGPWSGFRGAIGHFLHGWAAYIFAASFAALIGAFFATHASFSGSVEYATAGAAYGLIVGWIVGLVTLAADA
jgi:hypothetical protein